jgi:hypothetical protein
MTTEELAAHFADPPPRARLGIDIGRVLITPTRDDGSADTSFLAEDDATALATPPAAGMFDVVPDLVRRFDGRVWLVSKAGERIEALTRLWLAHHRFFDRTGIDPANVRFCRQREEKRDHAQTLALTHFIDDRIDVLAQLRGAVSCLALFGVQAAPIPAWVVHVPDWTTLGRAVERSA